MFEIVSGNIAEGVRYQVTGTGGIVYNSVTVNVGEFFVGVDTVTTYTVDSGTPVVIEASIYTGQSFAFENDFYLGLFNDESKFLGFSINYDTPDTLNKTLTKKSNKIITSNNRILKSAYYGERNTLNEGLLAEYLFEAGVLDTSGQGNHGVASDLSYVNDRNDNLDAAVSFNGSTSYMQVTNNPFYFANNQPFSFSFWYQLLSGQSGNDFFICSGNNIVEGINYIIGYNSANDYIYLIKNDSIGVGTIIIYDVPDRDIWHHLVFSFDGIRMKVYRDNIKINDIAFSFGVISSGSDNFFLGRDNGGGNDFLGYLDDLKIYNRALIESEITILYNE